MVFFFNDTATTEIYTLSLHDALPISGGPSDRVLPAVGPRPRASAPESEQNQHHGKSDDGVHAHQRSSISIDRKSTRLNSSHANISYAVFCLKKKQRLGFHRPLRRL